MSETKNEKITLEARDLDKVIGGSGDSTPVQKYHVGNYVRVNGYFRGHVEEARLSVISGKWVYEYRVFDGLRSSMWALEGDMEPWSKDKDAQIYG